MKRISLILALILIASCLGCALPGIAFAASETIYSDVLEDLGKDETFDAAQYPEKDDDKMDVFQVAESNAGELFLYVYQPQADKFTASEARISTSIGDNLSPKDYKLTLLSRNGTLNKYIVNDFTVLPDAVRYYVIVQLARLWNDDVDGKPSGNEAKTVPYPIGKQFTACTIDGNVTYTEKHTDVVTILPEQRFDGFLRYSDGFTLYATACDSWFVAFTCDYKIDKLMDADVEYTTRFVSQTIAPFVGTKTEYGEPYEHTFTLTNKDEVSHESRFLFFKSTYTWNRIEKAEDFIVKEDLTDEAKEQVKDKQWVLRFTETQFGISASGSATTSWKTEVSDVSILRLYFESDGKPYNLGVVSNKVTPDDTPDNNPDSPLKALDEAIKRLEQILKAIGDRFVKAGQWLAANWWVIIVGVVVLAIAVSLFFRVGRKAVGLVLTGIGKALWWFVKYLGIGLFYVITCPYWIIRAIVLKVREKRGS